MSTLMAAQAWWHVDALWALCGATGVFCAVLCAVGYAGEWIDRRDMRNRRRIRESVARAERALRRGE